MDRIFVALAAMAAVGIGVGPAWAGSPVYCALYSKEFVKRAEVDGRGSLPLALIQDRAFHDCLKPNEEAIPPTAYAEPATDGLDLPAPVDDGPNDASIDEAVIVAPPTIQAVAVQPTGEATPAENMTETAAITSVPAKSGSPSIDPRFADLNYFPPAVIAINEKPFGEITALAFELEPSEEGPAGADLAISGRDGPAGNSSDAADRLVCIAGCAH